MRKLSLLGNNKTSKMYHWESPFEVPLMTRYTCIGVTGSEAAFWIPFSSAELIHRKRNEKKGREEGVDVDGSFSSLSHFHPQELRRVAGEEDLSRCYLFWRRSRMEEELSCLLSESAMSHSHSSLFSTKE